jgi:hypothetical protein
MSITKHFPVVALCAVVILLAACASQPAATDAAKPVTPVTPAAPVTPVAAASETPAAKTEKDTAGAMEKKFQEAARSYKIVERDGKTLYCKREKRIGTTIPTMHCLTETELRNQVETADDMRERMRNSGKCTMGSGCGSGG